MAAAQTSGRPWTVQASASVSETLTDNALLSATNRRSDAITVLTAGFGVAGQSDRVRGALDYQLSGSIHARETKANNTTHSLRSQVQSELINDFFFIDAAAGISQQLISAFGPNDVSAASGNENRTQVLSLMVTPSLRGRIGTFAAYDARMTINRQDSDAGNVGDQSNRTQSLTLTSLGGRTLGWNAAVSRAITDHEGGRKTNYDRALLGLTYMASPNLRLSANAGREENDIRTLTQENNNTWGVALQWIPSERTQLSLSHDHRFFGNAHSISFLHRMERVSWRFSSSRDIQNSQSSGTAALTPAFDALFNLDVFAQQFPDPLLRRQAVLTFMQQRGISPDAVFAQSGLTSAVTLGNRQELSVGYQGLRSSVAFNAFRSSTRRLDGEVGFANDDLDRESLIRQHSVSLSFGHRLTPTSGINLTLTRSRSRGTVLSSSNNSAQLNWNADLTRRSRVSLGARRTEFGSSTSSYTENALYATLGVRF